MAAPNPFIAVLDDDRSVLRSLARLLRSAGYVVTTFDSALDFLTSVAISTPQCLILDVQMPEMNGFELQARLKDLGHQIPVLYITAHDAPQTRDAALQAGSVGLFLKPFNEAALLAAVARAVTP